MKDNEKNEETDVHHEHKQEEQTLHEDHVREEQALHEAHERIEAELDRAEEELHRKHVHEEEELHAAHGREEIKHQDNQVEITVRTPTGKWTHCFEKTAQVSQVIAATISHFGLEPGDYKLELKTSSETLDPHRTLVSYHIHNGEVLDLIPPDGGGQ